MIRHRESVRTAIAVAAFASAVGLLIAGHWEPEHCRKGEWWQQLWFPGVPMFVVAGMTVSLLTRPRRLGLLRQSPPECCSSSGS